jgi:AbrB family looped-hinge helix DNA binding protein
MKIEVTPKMYRKDKMYGTTSLGARGQLVIPAEARKDLKLKPGDKLVVMGKMGKALGLMKVDAMQEMITMIMNEIGKENVKGDFKKHIEKVMKQVK